MIFSGKKKLAFLGGKSSNNWAHFIEFLTSGALLQNFIAKYYALFWVYLFSLKFGWCKENDIFHVCQQMHTPLKTSLLGRLQTQTLPDATPPIGKIHPFSKIIVTLDPLGGFDALQDLESSKSLWQSLFYSWKSYLKPFGLGGSVN